MIEPPPSSDGWYHTVISPPFPPYVTLWLHVPRMGVPRAWAASAKSGVNRRASDPFAPSVARRGGMSASADGARTHEQVERFELPEADAAALIGRGGSRLGEVRRRAAGASIHLSAGGSSSGRRVLQLRGSVEAIGTAVSLIEKELCAPLRRAAGPSTPATPPTDAAYSKAAPLRPPPPPHEPPRIWPMFRAYAAVAGKPPPAPTEPSQPHYLVHLECCGVLASAHLRSAFAENLEGLTALIEQPATPEESSPSPPASPMKP